MLVGFGHSNKASLAGRIVQRRDVRSVVISNLDGKTQDLTLASRAGR